MKLCKGKLTRTLTNKECWWLKEKLPKGKIVYKYSGYTSIRCLGMKGDRYVVDLET